MCRSILCFVCKVASKHAWIILSKSLSAGCFQKHVHSLLIRITTTVLLLRVLLKGYKTSCGFLTLMAYSKDEAYGGGRFYKQIRQKKPSFNHLRIHIATQIELKTTEAYLTNIPYQ